MPTCIRLTDYKNSENKEKGFFKNENRCEEKQNKFKKICNKGSKGLPKWELCDD